MTVVAEKNIPGPEEVAFQDYFGFEELHKWYFPDKKQWITFKVMSEGDRAQYQKQTSRDVTLERQSGNARIKVDPGEERQILVSQSVTGWFLYKEGKEYPYSDQNFKAWYVRANPKLIDSLVDAIREQNPWLVTDSMTVEAVDEEIAKLQETREKLVKEAAGKAASS